jgi:putative ABC transport system substrate-binding protein
MRRRDFITLLGGAAIWPLAARAQRLDRTRRVGVLMTLEESDSSGMERISAFAEELRKLGWSTPGNLSLDVRWGAGDLSRLRQYAAELIGLSPDVVLAVGGVTMQALQQASSNVPVVFAQVLDPVGAGYVASLARPGGNFTGFTNFEYGVTGKWLELLKEAAPHITRAVILRDPAATAGTAQLAAIQAVAPSLRVEITPLSLHDRAHLERDLVTFARVPNGGVIVPAGAQVTIHRELIIALVSQLRLPAIYPYRHFVNSGGLLSYGPDVIDQIRRAAGYVDRILKGEKPADLPVQAPTKYELIINLKAAKVIGVDVPATLLARADEVIE